MTRFNSMIHWLVSTFPIYYYFLGRIDLLHLKIEISKTETRIELKAIREALPSNKRIVKIDEKIKNKVSPYIILALVLNKT